MAKPLANGFPIGAILVRDEIAKQVGIGKSIKSMTGVGRWEELDC
jgi:acetylornithine/succinyldiaminopimelate/putrescine aminotransferase